VATPIMLRSRLNSNVIDIKENSTSSGAALDAYPSKVGQSLAGPTIFAANQTWEFVPDPLGSSHSLLKNPGTKHCITIADGSLERGAGLRADSVATSNNEGQLWDFLPDQFGSGYFFIQNPRTGYVIEIIDGSTESGAALVVNPRRLFGNSYQLWEGVEETWQPATMPLVTLAPSNQIATVLGGNQQYVLLPTDTSDPLVGITVTVDIIEDLVTESFTIQVNGNPPISDGSYFAHWSQFGVVFQDNTLQLFQQVWHALGAGPKDDPLETETSYSPALTEVKNNTVPAGTRIILSLIADPNSWVIGVAGIVLDESGNIVGTPQAWTPIGQPVAHPKYGACRERFLSPLGALQVAIVGPPSGTAEFTSGMGTIAVTTTPPVAAQQASLDPHGITTGESSNLFYGQVQSGTPNPIVQPFGVPNPKVTAATSGYNFSGSGLYPNSHLNVKATFLVEDGGTSSLGTPSYQQITKHYHSTSNDDGTFAVVVPPPEAGIPDETGTVTVKITDAYGNWAQGTIPTNENATPLTTTKGFGEQL
jgi:ricin-type beta-trefoil lectin protein